jgi:drug/metabolite transporter (DMT)-like permease
MLCTVIFFAVLETTGKYLSRFYPVPEVVWARYTVHLLLMLVVLAPRLRLRLVRTARPIDQILRATLLLGSTLCNFAALSFLPLAEVKAISFVSPLLVAIFAVWFLRASMCRGTMACRNRRFSRSLVYRTSRQRHADLGFGPALGTALCYSLYQIMTRRISEDEDPITTLFYTALVGFLVMSAIMPFLWVTPSLKHLPLMLLLGTMGACGHFLLIKALELERASALSPLGYTQLLWVTLLGYLVFGDLPDQHAVIGMVSSWAAACTWHGGTGRGAWRSPIAPSNRQREARVAVSVLFRFALGLLGLGWFGPRLLASIWFYLRSDLDVQLDRQRGWRQTFATVASLVRQGSAHPLALPLDVGGQMQGQADLEQALECRNFRRVWLQAHWFGCRILRRA